MIMFWNRREIYLGYSMTDFADIRSILSRNHVKYDYKVLNHGSSAGRGHSGAFGINTEYSYQYYVYVHKKDYELACGLLHRNP